MIVLLSAVYNRAVVFEDTARAANFMWGRDSKEWFFWRPGRQIQSCLDKDGSVKYLQERMEGKHSWWTVCGYDGDQDVVIHVQGDTEEEALGRIPEHVQVEHVFEGNLDDIEGDAESFTIDEGGELPEGLVVNEDNDYGDRATDFR
jgi:hypothetical protein